MYVHNTASYIVRARKGMQSSLDGLRDAAFSADGFHVTPVTDEVCVCELEKMKDTMRLASFLCRVSVTLICHDAVSDAREHDPLRCESVTCTCIDRYSHHSEYIA